jgi:hypothetical protein
LNSSDLADGECSDALLASNIRRHGETQTDGARAQFCQGLAFTAIPS